MKTIINVIIGLVLLTSSLFTACILSLLCCPIWYISRRLYYSLMELIAKIIYTSILVVFNRMAPSKIRLYSSDSMPILFDRRGNLNLSPKSIAISNHQLYNDWAYVWHLCHLANISGAVKIISKKTVAKVPLAGWSMYFADFILLDRNWKSDKVVFEEKLDSYSKHLDSLSLLIFPEGTTLCDKSKIKSQAFSVANNEPVLKHCLTPRSLGLFTSIQGLRGSIEYVYDFTFAFDGIEKDESPEEIYTLKKMYLEGGSPANVHIHIKKFSLDDIPQEENEFKFWLLDVWKQKDELLEEFYNNGKFPSQCIEKSFDVRFVDLIKLFIFCLSPYILYSLVFK